MPVSTAEPPGALVAGFAGCRRRGMSLAGLADGEDTVVAGGTAADDAGVVHLSAGERHGAEVAVLAGQRGGDVVCGLRQCPRAAVLGAGAAVAARRICDLPADAGGGGGAGCAGGGLRGMLLAGLADGDGTVVAGGTAADDAGVVHLGAGERHGAAVAVLAGQRRWDVGCGLGQCHGAAVVAGGAAAGEVGRSYGRAGVWGRGGVESLAEG